jgi:hypothetical protein
MNSTELQQRLREVVAEPLPLPGAGQTAERHRRLLELGREDLSLARLAEAHFDAVAILAEAGREPCPNALYGVWASEIPGKSLTLTGSGDCRLISGSKMFASGAGIVDRALMTVDAPNPYLIDVDVRPQSAMQIDLSAWKVEAFVLTNTATIHFTDLPASSDRILKDRGWYLERPGFWHGACGPAACWAGGAIALVDWACAQSRSDPHTLAHLGAMRAMAWQMQGSLEVAGREIDHAPEDTSAAHVRALTVRHLIEQTSAEIQRRFGRAYGPFPLAMDEQTSRRYQELEIYLRQCHGERDLEALGQASLCTTRSL